MGRGQPKLTEEERLARKITKSKFAAIASEYLNRTEKELSSIYSDKETPALDKIVVKAIMMAQSKGNLGALNFLLDRVIGKVTDNVNHTSSDGSLKVQFVKPKENE